VARKASRSQPYLLLSTAGSQKEANKIAQLLLKRRNAACVNLIPGVNSLYWWRGKIDQSSEVMIVIKKERRHLKAVEQLLRTIHSYTTPELIGWPINWGHEPYLDWLRDSLSYPSS
jgi:periplasmic divalent cation tolerance protein